MVVALLSAALLFILLWWILVTSGDEAPWLPAGLITIVFLLVVLSAREVLMRRAWTHYLLEHGIKPQSKSRSSSHSGQKKSFSASLHSAALRAIQKQSAAADSPNATPESHLDVAVLCNDYLTGTEEVIRSGNYGSEKGIALRAGQERVRALHKRHLLIWARDQSRALTHDAQQKARTSDKIETANKALECIDSALRVYPDEAELHESKGAIGEFIASVRVAHWVELAERSAFKGQYRKAIDRYKDALFYLNDSAVKEEVRVAGTTKIEREIDQLRDRWRSAREKKARERETSGGEGQPEA